jgi:hypothetical protein
MRRGRWPRRPAATRSRRSPWQARAAGARWRAAPRKRQSRLPWRTNARARGQISLNRFQRARTPVHEQPHTGWIVCTRNHRHGTGRRRGGDVVCRRRVCEYSAAKRRDVGLTTTAASSPPPEGQTPCQPLRRRRLALLSLARVVILVGQCVLSRSASTPGPHESHHHHLPPKWSGASSARAAGASALSGSSSQSTSEVSDVPGACVVCVMGRHDVTWPSALDVSTHPSLTPSTPFLISHTRSPHRGRRAVQSAEHPRGILEVGACDGPWWWW